MKGYRRRVPLPTGRRVSREHADRVFERMNRDGHLQTVLDMLEDEADFLDRSLRLQLANPALLLTDDKVRGDFVAQQGALQQTLKILRSFETHGKRKPLDSAEKPRVVGA